MRFARKGVQSDIAGERTMLACEAICALTAATTVCRLVLLVFPDQPPQLSSSWRGCSVYDSSRSPCISLLNSANAFGEDT